MSTARIAAAFDEAVGDFSETMTALAEVGWEIAPTGTKWTASGVTDHVVQSLESAAARLTSLGRPAEARVGAVRDRDIPYLFYQGEEPPGLFSPRTDRLDSAVALRALLAAAKNLRPILAAGTMSEWRAAGMAHPLFGWFDAAQWRLFTIAHLHRHRADLLALHKLARESAASAP